MATIYTPWAALVNAAFIVCFIVFTQIKIYNCI